MKRRKIFFFVLVLILSVNKTFGQQAEAFMTVDTNAMMIGDQINLQIGINLPADFEVMWPQSGDSLSENIEIVKRSAIDTTFAQQIKQLKQNLVITSFDSGYYQIPPVRFTFRHKDDTLTYSANTNSIFIKVNVPVVDTAQAFKSIKGPISEPITFMEMLPWIGLALAIAGITWLIVWYIRKRRKNQPVFQKKIRTLVPPHILALNKLEELRLAKIWQQGRIKEYHTDLTDIVREYLENRFHFEAMEMTSDEIMVAVAENNINDDASAKLSSVLQLADLVKFAKAHPIALENDLSLNHCIDFVNETKLNVVQNEAELQEIVNKEN